MSSSCRLIRSINETKAFQGGDAARMQGKGVGCCQRPSEGGDGGQEPRGDQRAEAQRERIPGSVLCGEPECLEKRRKGRREVQRAWWGLHVEPLGQGLCSRQGCGHATGDSEGTVSGPPRKGVPQTGAQCDDSRGRGGPSLGMSEVLAGPPSHGGSKTAGELVGGRAGRCKPARRPPGA